jgi:hypothetical protein
MYEVELYVRGQSGNWVLEDSDHDEPQNLIFIVERFANEYSDYEHKIVCQLDV